MKTEESDKAHKARLSEGMRLIFDQETSSSHSSSRSSSQDSSYSSSQSSCSTHGPHGSRRRRHRRRSRSSSSDSDSSSDNHSRTRSRSHPRCHRASDRSRCRHRHHSPPPRRHRPHSRSFSPSPDRSYHHGRRHRAYSRSSSRSSSRGRYTRRWRRSRSRSSSYRGVTKRFEGRYRCRFSPSPRRHDRSYRNRSRSLERSAVRLSQKDKMDLLNIAKENASKIIGVQNPELPASVKSMEQQTKLQEKKSESNTEELVRADPVPQKKPAQDKDVSAEDDLVRTSPSRKPITFSINNTVAKPSSSPTFHVGESKVTSRADSVGNRKPYGQWVPVKKSSNKR